MPHTRTANCVTRWRTRAAARKRLRRRDLPRVGDPHRAQRTEYRGELLDERRRPQPNHRHVMARAAEARKDPPDSRTLARIPDAAGSRGADTPARELDLNPFTRYVHARGELDDPRRQLAAALEHGARERSATRGRIDWSDRVGV